MRSSLFLFFAFTFFFAPAQKPSLFGDIRFDSSYSIIAVSLSYHMPQQNAPQYCFLVHDLGEMDAIKKEWMAEKPRPSVSTEAYSIMIYVVKGKELVSSSLSIYPVQGAINDGRRWYDFDMRKFARHQALHPLNYRSNIFKFQNYLDYVFFKDSIQSVPDFLFLVEPTAKRYEGHFEIIAARGPDHDSPIFVLDGINKELEKLSPGKKFSAGYVENDPFNVSNKDKVKISVQCSRALYDAYEANGNDREEWQPSTFDSKVFFRE